MDISASDFEAGLHSNKFIVLDVREELEYKTFNLGGVNMPLGDLIRNSEELEFEKNQDIVVLCQHGLRSKTACQVLEQQGYIKVRNLQGGILAWRKLKKQ